MLGLFLYICIAIGIWLAYPKMEHYGKIGSHEILNFYRHNATDMQLNKFIELRFNEKMHKIGRNEVWVNEWFRDYIEKDYKNVESEKPNRLAAGSIMIRETVKSIEQMAYIFVEDSKI